MVAIVSNKREAILKAVEDMYTEVANRPAHPFHFPTGRRAAELLGYPPAELDVLPAAAVESFAGVGYPFAAGAIRAGDSVLDIGSGSGTDALLAARLAGAQGKVYALDLTEAMRAKLARNIASAGAVNIEIIAGNAEHIPLPDQSVDAVTSNGVLNLVPDKTRAIREILRVLKPGGRLQISDIALAKPITGKARRDPKLWAECIVGAVEEDAYLDLFRETGFKHVEHVSSFDYFAHARGEDTRLMAGYFGAHAITFRARRPEAFETARAPADDTAVRRLARSAGGQFAGISGAIAASAACFGAPVLVSTASAIGATALTDHATLYPIFVGAIALSLWQLYRSARERGKIAPFLLGLTGGATAAVFLWLMVTGIVPLPGVALYGALGVLIAGSLWEMAGRFMEVCVAKIRREMARDRKIIPVGRKVANGAAISIAAAAAFYGMYKSVETFAPRAEAADIACFGINACKGQTQCATAWNACPGQNSCKGKGFLYTSTAECTTRGGVPLKGSAADPARDQA
ncbi:MAG: MerC family mercury resistance protein [Pseudomonadota bacterium]